MKSGNLKELELYPTTYRELVPTQSARTYSQVSKGAIVHEPVRRDVIGFGRREIIRTNKRRALFFQQQEESFIFFYVVLCSSILIYADVSIIIPRLLRYSFIKLSISKVIVFPSSSAAS